MKHHLTFLSALLATTFLIGNAVAESCGEGCTYTLTTDGYGRTIAKIDDGVTSIPSEAFSRRNDISEMIIPDSVTSIGDRAFYSMGGLYVLTIPESVTSIGDGAFSWMTGLIHITIPNSVTSIGENAFGSVSSMLNIHCEGNMCNYIEANRENIGLKSRRLITYTKDENGVYDFDGTLYSSITAMASCGDMATCLASIGTHCSTAEECQTLLDMSSEGTNCNSVSSCKTYLAEHSSAGNKTDSALIEKYNGTPLLYGKKIYTVEEAMEATKDGERFHVGLTYK